MNNRNEFLTGLTQIKDEINRQIPIATNRFEEFECVPAYNHLNEEEVEKYEEEINQNFIAHEEKIKEANGKYYIYNYINKLFEKFLLEEKILRPQDVTPIQRESFKEKALAETNKLQTKIINSQKLLGKGLNLNISNIKVYLNDHIDALIETLSQGVKLEIEDPDLRMRFKKDDLLAEHRKISRNEMVTINPNFVNLLKSVTTVETRATLKKISILANAAYYERINSEVGYCDEHVLIALSKIKERFSHELIYGEMKVVERICVTYYYESGEVEDGHVFIAINRDPNSTLNDIATWGKDAIVFDAWNKFVCFAEDFNTLPLHYFSYPDGGKWEAIAFTWDDFSLMRHLKELDEHFAMTQHSNYVKREARLKEEYQLTVLDNETFSATQKFLSNMLEKALPENFKYHFELFITTEGDKLVHILNGFREPKIAIHKEFIAGIAKGEIPLEELEFGLIRALLFIKNHPVTNEAAISEATHYELDKQALEKFKKGPTAIEYLRRANDLEKLMEKQAQFHMSNLTQRSYDIKTGTAYVNRIKNMTLLLAQNDLLANAEMQAINNPQMLAEIQSIQNRTQYYIYPAICKTRKDKINFLESQLITLQDELLPFEITSQTSARLNEFCLCLRELKIDFKNVYERLAVDKLVESAFILRIPAFERIYAAILGIVELHGSSNWKRKQLAPLGPFKNFQIEINNFISAKDITTALKAAENISLYDRKLKNHFISVYIAGEAASHLYRYTKEHHHKAPTGPNRFFGSTIGWHIQWRSFEMKADGLPWDQHLLWCKQDDSRLIAKTLWRLGVVRDKRIWDFFTYEELIAAMNHEIVEKNLRPPLFKLNGTLGNYSDNQYFSDTIEAFLGWRSRNHVLQDHMFDNPFLTFDEAYREFYDKNIAALISPLTADNGRHKRPSFNVDNDTVRCLLAQFADVVLKGNEEDRQVVREFYLGRKDNRDLANLQKGPGNIKSFLYPEDPYLKFFFDQFKNPNSKLFSLKDFLEICHGSEIHFAVSYIPAEDYIYFFDLPFTNLTMECTKQLIPLLEKHHHTYSEQDVIETHIEQYGPYTAFSDAATSLCKLMNDHMGSDWHARTRTKLLKLFVWPNLKDIPAEINIHDLITLFRSYDSALLITNFNAQKKLQNLILQRILHLNDSAEKLLCLEELLFTDKLALKIPLSDLEFRNVVVKHLIEILFEKYGKDTNEASYFSSIKPKLDEINQKTAHRDLHYLMNLLTIAIQSQQTVSDYLGTLLEPEKYLAVQPDGVTRPNAIIVLSSIASHLGKNPEDKIVFLNYLSLPLTRDALNKFANYLLAHQKSKKIAEKLGYKQDLEEMDIDTTKQVAKLIYTMFWDRNLQERAVVINYLLIPPNTMESEQSEKEAYREAFTYVASKLFPNAKNDKQENAALAFLTAYLDSAETYAKSYLLTAMLVTSTESQQRGEKIRVGKKLALLCEHMGPAYVKLAQAIHSHPQTSSDIREDLSHIKGRANPLPRWQLWRLLSETLPVDQKNKIIHLGNLLGSASYNLALQAKLDDGRDVVLLLLRENAMQDAKKGFAHLKAAITICQHKKIIPLRRTLLEMIEEASELSLHELNYQSGDKQAEIANEIYNTSLDVKSEINKSYHVEFHPAKTLASGKGYRFLEEMPGIEFNDILANTPNKIAQRKVIAKSVLTVELANILNANYFDCDRHGNQLRLYVEEEKPSIHLGLYDFGEMSLDKPTGPEVELLNKFIDDLPSAMFFRKSFDALLAKHIEKSIHAGQQPRYLMRIRKAFLALQDFKNVLSSAELYEVLKAVQSNGKIHPLLKASYDKVLNRIEWKNWFSDGFGLFSKKPTKDVIVTTSLAITDVRRP